MMLRRTFATATRVVTQSIESKPEWLQHIMQDKRTYFEKIDEIKKSFVTGFSIDNETNIVTFKFDAIPSNRKEIKTSFYQLRENCRCPKCFDVNSQNRRFNLLNLNLKERPSVIELDTGKQLLKVKWESNGHESYYSGPWLRATFSPNPLFEPVKKVHWRSNDMGKHGEKIEQFNFEHFCKDNSVVIKCLETLDQYGIIKVINAPKRVGVLDEIGKKVGFLKPNAFG